MQDEHKDSWSVFLKDPGPGAVGLPRKHVVPNNDLRDHDLEEDCPCKPTLIDGSIFVHHSWDMRETFELGGKAR